MAGIVNEAYTLDVNVQEAGAPEQSVNVRAWNVADTSVLDKTTDAGGDITSTVLIAEEHSITLTSTRNTTVFNPFRLRALKWQYNVLQVSINLSAPSKQTLFISLNTNLTETVQATVQAYTGITFNHVGDTVTLDGTGGTPVNNMDRFYDRSQDEAIVNEQVTPEEVLSTIDGQNYVLEYDWTVSGFAFAGQNKALSFAATKALTITGASGDVSNITITVGDVNLGTGTGGTTLTNLNMSNGALDFSIAGTYTLDNCQVDELTNSSGGAVTVNLTNGSTFVTNTGPNITTVNTQTVQVTGVTWGTSCKIIANETVGSVTAGDTILEAFANSSGVASTSFNYEGDIGVEVRARNQGLCIAAISEDSTVFTNETLEASSTTTNDMTLLPTTTPAVNDAFYYGHNEQFNRIKVEISTAGTGTYTLAFEYWNGAWVAVSGLADQTNAYKTATQGIISFTLPGDWATTTIDGEGPLYYFRTRLTGGTVTASPVGRTATIDASRYLPFVQTRTIGSTGLDAAAVWIQDTISKFDPLTGT